jgi:hypothetical protein
MPSSPVICHKLQPMTIQRVCMLNTVFLFLPQVLTITEIGLFSLRTIPLDLRQSFSLWNGISSKKEIQKHQPIKLYI